MKPLRMYWLLSLWCQLRSLAHAFQPCSRRSVPSRWLFRKHATTTTKLYVLADYSQPAAALFNNMKTPASILAAGMVSLGFLAPFKLPTSILDNPEMVRRVELLKRAYILVTLISFCSELLTVVWATVAVNQLTERVVAPTESLWQLLQGDFDLAWAGTNSHFVVGLVGFMYMVGIRGYIMLLAAEASEALIAATLSGVGAALCLMVSVVNRGIEAGGGGGLRYGTTVLDLFGHYVALLYERAVDLESFGPLELTAIVLELLSVGYAIYAILLPGLVPNGKRVEGTKTEEEEDFLGNPISDESVDITTTSGEVDGGRRESLNS